MTRLLFALESGPQFDVQASAAEHGVESSSLPALSRRRNRFSQRGWHVRSVLIRGEHTERGPSGCAESPPSCLTAPLFF
jgi:hypothetical protein